MSQSPGTSARLAASMRDAPSGTGNEPSGADCADQVAFEEDAAARLHHAGLGIEDIRVFDEDRTGRNLPQAPRLLAAKRRQARFLDLEEFRSRLLPALGHHHDPAVDAREEFTLSSSHTVVGW